MKIRKYFLKMFIWALFHCIHNLTIPKIITLRLTEIDSAFPFFKIFMFNVQTKDDILR
jgi:hypothetical protein